GVGDGCGADVDVPVEDAEVDPLSRRDAEDAGAHLADGDIRGLGGDDVERGDRLREVHPVIEPEPVLLVGPPIFAEQDVVRIHLLPALGAGWRRDFERAGKPNLTAHCYPPPPRTPASP